MRALLTRLLTRLAPGTSSALRDLNEVRQRYGSLEEFVVRVDVDRIDRLVKENARLRDEIDDLRREGRYVAELYDLVVERVRVDSAKK